MKRTQIIQVLVYVQKPINQGAVFSGVWEIMICRYKVHRMWALGKRVDIWDYFHFHFTFTFFFFIILLSLYLSTLLSLWVYLSLSISLLILLPLILSLPGRCLKSLLYAFRSPHSCHISGLNVDIKVNVFFLLAFIFNFLTQSFVWKRDLLPILRVSNKKALLRWRVVYFFLKKIRHVSIVVL